MLLDDSGTMDPAWTVHELVNFRRRKLPVAG